MTEGFSVRFYSWSQPVFLDLVEVIQPEVWFWAETFVSKVSQRDVTNGKGTLDFWQDIVRFIKIRALLLVLSLFVIVHFLLKSGQKFANSRNNFVLPLKSSENHGFWVMYTHNCFTVPD